MLSTRLKSHHYNSRHTVTWRRYWTDVESHVWQIIIVHTVFVADLLVTGNDLVQIENVKQSVATRYALTV